MNRALIPLSLLATTLFAGCGSDEGSTAASPPYPDAGDAAPDAAGDAGSDTSIPDAAWPDAPGDASGSDAEAGADVQADAPSDAPADGSDGAPVDASPPAVEGQTVTLRTGGISARWDFEDAFDNVEDGDWYRDRNNETATLAWGEAYVMMGLAAMFRATSSPTYLERLAWHVDGVISSRDDRRGVTDYRGVSAACWQNKHYQPNDEGYCYVVHSGMIAYPMVEFARLVREAGLEEEIAWDGTNFGDKADAYVAAAQATVAAHDDQWNDAGYYVFRPDATFLGYPGSDLPLNQSNTMGRLLLALHAVTSDATYLDKATKLAQRFKNQLSTGSGGEYLWNYWGGTYASPGEDISHAAINVDFAAMAAEQGVVFTDTDLDAFSRTFMGPVYVDDRTLSNFVGGGDTNGSSYKPQCGRWLRLTRVRTAVYAAVRDLYELEYDPGSVGSGSLLYGWAALAEHEPIHRDHFFYSVDWIDQGDWREAEAYGANVLTTPPDLDAPSVVLLAVDVPRATNVQQWDGAAYHTVVRWLPTSGPATRWVPFEPRWPFVYWNDGVLYQFADSFVSGDGLRVKESPGFALPQITSSPPVQGSVGTPLGYTAEGQGDGPTWWALRKFPIGARIDPASGAIAWTPAAPGTYDFVVQFQNDFGQVEQAFSVVVPSP